nr:MAG TPA: hypothetical protein [Caudoviricetes sp.]
MFISVQASHRFFHVVLRPIFSTFENIYEAVLLCNANLYDLYCLPYIC